MASPDKCYDALIVGSGAAGSIAAKELTERGLDVLLLEAGRDITPADFVPAKPTPPRAMGIDLVSRAEAMLRGQIVQARRAMFKKATSPFLVNDLQLPYTTEHGSRFLWIRGRQLGGRLHSYGRVLLRSSDHEFKAASRDGHGQDWPISYADLAPFYDRIEEFLGLYGTAEGLEVLPDGRYCGPSNLTSAEHVFKETVERLWAGRHVVPWRYAAPNPHRVPLGIIAARNTGRLTTRTDAVVQRVTVSRHTGRADGVVFIDRITKRQHRAFADAVVLCASAIESVRLLLNSATDAHPNGLGNSSGMLGHYFMDQTPSLLFGEAPDFPGSEDVDAAPHDDYYPPAGGVYIPRFRNLDGDEGLGFARGWAVQGTIGRLPVPDGHAGVVGLMAFGEMLPAYGNRVTLHPWRKDAWGMPLPRIGLTLSDNERALMRDQVDGLRAMAEASGYRVNFAGSALGLDSRRIWPGADPLSRAVFRLGFPASMAMGAAIHECGGARMGADPATSVLDEFNRAWDVPNLFVTDAAAYVSNGGVGPTLTIMAMTARSCQHLADRLADGSL